VDGRVTDGTTVWEGLYAAGECACVSVHGANRLGTNSLVELIVYGRRAGRDIASYVRHADKSDVSGDAAEKAKTWTERVNRLKGAKGSHPGDAYEEMKETMMVNVGVYRNASDMEKALADIRNLRDAYKEIAVQDEGKDFNTEVLSLLELENLQDLALHTAAAALNRTESRGAHSRKDFPDRDDDEWLKHSLTKIEDGEVTIDYKSVDVSRWEPKPRIY
jgi:succinate dehydrogenase / fumarate reductase flavoprotein subunit